LQVRVHAAAALARPRPHAVAAGPPGIVDGVTPVHRGRRRARRARRGPRGPREPALCALAGQGFCVFKPLVKAEGQVRALGRLPTDSLAEHSLGKGVQAYQGCAVRMVNGLHQATLLQQHAVIVFWW
jgi:hypothetical protein